MNRSLKLIDKSKISLGFSPNGRSLCWGPVSFSTGACLYKSVEVVLAKAAVPISSLGRVTFLVSLEIKIYQA